MKVVHCKGNSQNTESYHYIGRPKGNDKFHFGNPFSHEAFSKALVKVSNRDEACDSFKDWLDGKRYTDVAPERRQWILDNLSLLKGKDLGCWCSPQRCHGDYLLELANRKNLEVNMIYAGIGSRETPEHILVAMKAIGFSLAQRGWTLRSGGASGADQAFEKGCASGPGNKEIYLPWKGFEGNDSPLYTITKEAMEMGKQYHPAWDNCSVGAKKMHSRNCHQVMGQDLKTPVSFVVCWTVNASGKGGTGQALRIAKGNNIPILDLGNCKTTEEAIRLFFEFLKGFETESTFIPMSGNILTSEAESLVNTVNCVGIMGKGLAADFKEAYPAMFLEYKKVCDAGKLEPGKLHIWRNVINFPTKIDWRNDSKLEWIESGLDKLVLFIKNKNIKSIAIPPLGCGNGNLDKPTVKKLVEDKLRHLNISIEMWNFE